MRNRSISSASIKVCWFLFRSILSIACSRASFPCTVAGWREEARIRAFSHLAFAAGLLSRAAFFCASRAAKDFAAVRRSTGSLCRQASLISSGIPKNASAMLPAMAAISALFPPSETALRRTSSKSLPFRKALIAARTQSAGRLLPGCLSPPSPIVFSAPPDMPGKPESIRVPPARRISSRISSSAGILYPNSFSRYPAI